MPEGFVPLPMHLCDWAAMTGAFALWFRKQILVELTYFCGLTGTLQGLVTPNLGDAFPHARFLAFFLLHATIVIVSFYMVFGRRQYPRRNSVWRCFLLVQVYVLVAFFVNILMRTITTCDGSRPGCNYGFLFEKPQERSLIDYLGPHPWYILSLEGLALVFFFLLYVPFIWRNHRKAQENA